MLFRIARLGLSSKPRAVRCLPVPSVGAASGASTCSSPPAPASTSWSSGGGKSGSVASASGAGTVGVDPSGADGSGAGPAPVVFSWVDDPGAGVVEAGSSWRFMMFADLIQLSLLSYKSKKGSMFIMQPDANSQRRLLFDGPFHPYGPSRCLRCWWRGFTILWRSPRHGDGDNCGGRWGCSFFFGLGSGGGSGRTTGGHCKHGIYQCMAIQ
jgi:hypothetical protein